MFFPRFLAQDPTRVAASEAERVVTYGELERASSAAAATLAARGAGPEVLVGLRGQRGIDFLVAILGCIRAGAAWLPLDPQTPPERLARLLESARPELVVDVGTAWSGELSVVALEPGNLAYVIFTSGSTGLPKGAMVEHRGMMNHLEAKIEVLGLSSSDTVAHTAPPTFDISVWQFLAVLLVGGRVDFVPDEELADVLSRDCTILEVVPSLLRVLLDRGGASSLRWLIPTGEALPPELARRWLRRYPSIPMLNAYGPTECSDDVTHAIIRTEPPAGVTRMPIGFPIPGVELVVRDGELWVGGVAVGRGYRNDPVRTAEVFVDGWYRTGDLVNQLPDGSYEYLGRRDSQVKVRGIRLELGEIEALLGEHPAVREVAAKLEDERLVVYYAGDAPDLKAFAAARLPVMPARFVQLDALPLTPHGKLDRANLLEQGLMELFRELLGRPVGVTDDFFEEGGDSLRAIELCVRVQAHYGASLAPSVLVEDGTPRLLAARLRSGRAPWPTVVRLCEGEGVPLVLVPGAGGSVVYLRSLARRLARPVLGLVPPGLDGVTEPFQSVAELAAFLVGEVPRPCVLAGHSLGAWTAFAMARLLGDEVRALAVLDMPARVGLQDDRWMLRVVETLLGQGGSWDDLLERVEGTPLRGLARMFLAERNLAHQVEGYLAGTLHLLRTDEFSPLGPQWGWEKHAERVVVHRVTGNHMTLLGEPEVVEVLGRLERE